MDPQRLSGLDASFLALEEGGAHMHVGSCLVFEGTAPTSEELAAQLERRLHLVPRHRCRLASVPLGQGRPVWVDDPHFTLGYHLRHTALPGAAGMDELRALTGRVLSQRLDRSKPPWELWLVDGVGPDRWALLAKTHLCLVDGLSGVDVTTVLLDLERDPPEPAGGAVAEPWVAEPEPSGAKLLADALIERAWSPLGLAREVGGALLRPAQTARRAVGVASGIGSVARAAPPSPYNVPVGPHRRFAWVEADLGRFEGIADALGGTVEEAVLTAVAGALREHLIGRGRDVAGLTLRAMVPVSVRAPEDRGGLATRVTTTYAPLPVHEADPAARFALVHAATGGFTETGQAVGAEVLTRLAGVAPPTVLARAARLQAHQRLFNLTVSTVPGPQFGLYLLGRRLERIIPQVPLAGNAALGVAAASYDGTLSFGLLGDYDAMSDLDELAAGLRTSIDELALAAGLGRSEGRFGRAGRRTAASRA